MPVPRAGAGAYAGAGTACVNSSYGGQVGVVEDGQLQGQPTLYAGRDRGREVLVKGKSENRKGWKRPLQSSSPTISPFSRCTLTMSLGVTSTCFFEHLQGGDSTTSMGSLCRCLTTLLEKFFLISNLNLP